MSAKPFRMLLTTACVALATLLPAVALSAGNEDSLLSPQKALSAWKCNVLAAAAKMPQAEIDRLFDLGYKYGKAALEAHDRGDFSKLPSEDYWKYYPEEWVYNVHGPTEEFQLGGVYSAVFNKTLDDLIYTRRLLILPNTRDREAVSEKAKEEYERDSCSSMR